MRALLFVLDSHSLSILSIFSAIFADDSRVLVFGASLSLYAPFSRYATPSYLPSKLRFGQFKYVNTIDHLFSRAFDVFSEVQRRLQTRANTALGRDTPNWQMKYGCPACGFEVRFPPYYVTTYSFPFSNRTRNALSPRGCTLSMGAAPKSVTKRPACVMNAQKPALYIVTTIYFVPKMSWHRLTF